MKDLKDRRSQRGRPKKKKSSRTSVWLILVIASLTLAWESPPSSQNTFGLVGCNRPGSEIGVEPSFTLQTTGENNPFVYVAPRETGEILALAHRGDVFNIFEGKARHVYNPENRASVVLSPNGDTFVVLGDQSNNELYSLFDALGAFLGMPQISPRGYVRPIPGSSLIFSPEYQMVGIDNRVVVNGRIVNANGEIQSTFPAKGLQFHRLTPRHVFYTTINELVKTKISGEEEWRIPLSVEKFEVDRDGEHLIANFGEDTRVVIHYLDKEQVAKTPLDSVVWNLAISPNGKYSVATTQKKAYVFLEGVLQYSAALPVEFAISADISDLGEVIAGVQDEDHTGHLLLLDNTGNIAWENFIDIDDHAFRPHVRFYQDTDNFIVLYLNGLTAFTINRSS